MQVQKITPFLWYDGKAAEAAKLYCSLFEGSKVLVESPMTVIFELAGQRFMALNGGPQFKFTEAFSVFVSCDSQQEVDRLWKALTADGGTESMCGWLTDKYGLSWQIIPTVLMDLMGDKDREKANRAIQAMLKMRKIDIAGLQQAAAGE